MKYFLLTCTLILAQMISGASETETDDTTVIRFTNPETEATVRDRLVRTYKLDELADESVPITVGQAARIEKLQLNIQGGANPLDGLEKLSNLTSLILGITEGSESLSDLGRLPHLTSLRIYCDTEADLVIPEGLGKLKYLSVRTSWENPPPISLRIESPLPSLEWVNIEYSVESIYLDAAVMPALQELYIADYGITNGWSIIGNERFKALEVSNTFPPGARIFIYDSKFIGNYDSLMSACRNVTGFHLQYLKNHEENPDAMETTYDLDFRPFTNLEQLSIGSRRVGRIQLPEKTENLTNLYLGYVSNTSVNISDPKSGLNRISILESQINEVMIHPTIKLDRVDLSTSTIEKLIMTTPRDTHLYEIQVKDIRISPMLTITDSSVSYSSLGGHHQLLESRDMMNWNPIHTSPDYTGEIRRYTYRKGIPKDAPQSFYKIVKVNP